MKITPKIILALTLFFALAGFASAQGLGKGMSALSPEKQAIVEKAHEEFATATADLKKQIFAKESALNAQIYGDTADEKKIEALVSEINALNARVYAEQVTLHRKMAKEGITPEPQHGKMSGMGCPMMSGGGMKHGMMGGMKHGMPDAGAAEQAPAEQNGHDAHAPTKQ
ncbi:periplasmic heavy metal sensor [Desulfomicrobium sp. ZS1]|jgi:zinc resistance-associated protein|uniref:periplasmic heavy metal sensor n=1 Tax=Desulfomicrobium sp. ZS1 TaxID=2952228 RepID=UPI0020B1840E|nr:periplasmic heavy metal sensor [Desulfomicrobium sp. ZS1]UTF49784.1 periplasmic heavy metal sensor [Desulfomicrobium sp. ZS1]